MQYIKSVLLFLKWKQTNNKSYFDAVKRKIVLTAPD